MVFVQSTDSSIGDVVVLQQYCLEFGWSNLEAIDFEDFFGTIDDPEPTLFVVDSYVAGFQEAFAVERCLCGAFVSPIAQMGDL